MHDPFEHIEPHLRHWTEAPTEEEQKEQQAYVETYKRECRQLRFTGEYLKDLLGPTKPVLTPAEKYTVIKILNKVSQKLQYQVDEAEADRQVATR